MERTQWETTYQGARCDVLQHLAAMPWTTSWTGHFIGQGYGLSDPNLMSLQEDEAKIAFLMTTLDRVLDRCITTAQHTSRSLLRWFWSTKSQACCPKPSSAFVALKSSEKKYCQVFKRFCAFAFCASQVLADIHRCCTEQWAENMHCVGANNG